ncbi:hypothetical protein C475_20477 [Halosimplex carlsbadense 2-9-1]|uniref:Uncharacterized protein n=1 Tax=Halosimplex carlsbadense 2-9-1 TaxID=797114 RepID=M0CCU5_9EURY|nr:hypothetical protein [Halosimplex carlsbadense]ELZ20458.1 hypothetical protein C475_20477 [Halosimplex carlsbadense 2-9-1]
MATQSERGVDRAEIERLARRLDAQERQLERVRNALKGVATEVGGLSVSGPCDGCERSLLLVREGQIFCPRCRGGATL